MTKQNYIRNTKQRKRNIGWGTNTIHALTPDGALVDNVASATVGDATAKERLEIMAKTDDRANVQEIKKQAPPKSSTQDKTIQAPEKTNTSSDTGTGKK